jgi:hypothetical protein
MQWANRDLSLGPCGSLNRPIGYAIYSGKYSSDQILRQNQRRSHFAILEYTIALQYSMSEDIYSCPAATLLLYSRAQLIIKLLQLSSPIRCRVLDLSAEAGQWDQTYLEQARSFRAFSQAFIRSLVATSGVILRCYTLQLPETY